jgi:hypothetical protein
MTSPFTRAIAAAACWDGARQRSITDHALDVQERAESRAHRPCRTVHPAARRLAAAAGCGAAAGGIVLDRSARLYVHRAAQPALIVNDLRLGRERGGVGLWIGAGTEAFFSDLKIAER